MTGDTYTLVGLGLGALLVLWLVLSLFRKVFGLLILAGIGLGAYLLWNDPALLGNVVDAARRMIGA